MSEPSPSLRRGRRTIVRRQRQRDRRRALATTTAILAVSTVVGIAAAGSTYALLNDRAVLGGATIQAGTVNLTVNGVASAAFGDWALSPTTSQARAFTVAVTGDTGATLSAKAQITSSTAIGANVVARITPIASTAACTTGLAGAQSDLATYSNTNLATLPKNGSGIYCLELSLKPTTPATQSGQTVSFTLTVSGAQNGN